MYYYEEEEDLSFEEEWENPPCHLCREIFVQLQSVSAQIRDLNDKTSGIGSTHMKDNELYWRLDSLKRFREEILDMLNTHDHEYR